jgi:tRNA G10  N-methylase Trm11
MSTLLLQLGNTPELSIREIEAVLSVVTTPVIENVLVSIETDANTPAPVEIMKMLGGTVKIFSLLCTLETDDSEALETAIAEQLSQDAVGKIHFALAELGRNHLPALNPTHIKKQIQSMGNPARFVESSRSGLSASVLIHQTKVREVALVYTNGTHLLAETAATQDIDSWTFRDRSKPYADRKKGMLPPKLARMMVNLCLGSSWSSDSILLDPFCGSGTVLLEAMVRGITGIGSDIDAEAVIGAQKNVNWLAQEYELGVAPEILKSDAANVKPGKTITHLVTEPFLGKPKPEAGQLPNMYKGLEKQYLGAFKHWRTFLAENASLVVVFPLVELPGKNPKIFSLAALIDKLSALGYTTHSEPSVYSRPLAIVQRQIYQFTYTAK